MGRKSKYIVTVNTHAGSFYRVPIDLPLSSNQGRLRMAEAIRDMTYVIRTRQNAIADFYDLEEEYYNWKKLSTKWYPGNGAYNPSTQYRKPNGSS